VDNRVGFRPVPVVVNIKAFKEVFLSREGLFEGVNKKGFAKSSGPA